MDAFGINEKRFNEIFSKNLRDMMYKRDINQRQLADAIHVSSASVSDWYNGKKTPRMDKIDMICQVLNCSRSDLMLEKVKDLKLIKEQEEQRSTGLTYLDTQLIIKILQLDEAGRSLVDLVVDHELERVRATKKDTKGAD